DSVLHHLAESILHATLLLGPIMPTAMAKAQEQIGWARPEGFTLNDLKWGLLGNGHQLGLPVPLFPRVEVAEPTP
ncbi:MAG: methionine--tRNA ligase, partial [Prosthecobacter sp.]|nr:methionine--tRNA ligase [Prosthecobacter sp.]